MANNELHQILSQIDAEPEYGTPEYNNWMQEYTTSLKEKTEEELRELLRELDQEWEARITIPRRGIMQSVSDRRNSVSRALENIAGQRE